MCDIRFTRLTPKINIRVSNSSRFFFTDLPQRKALMRTTPNTIRKSKIGNGNKTETVFPKPRIPSFEMQKKKLEQNLSKQFPFSAEARNAKNLGQSSKLIPEKNGPRRGMLPGNQRNVPQR